MNRTASRATRRGAPGRRVAVAYAILAAAIAVIAVIGTALQPSYGSLPPEGGVSVLDLRSAPTPTGWSLDLGAVFAPGVPGSCLSFQSGALSPTLELVSATVPITSSTQENALCSPGTSEVEGRLAAIDPRTGHPQWLRSLGGDLNTTVSSLVWHRSAASGDIVVGVNGSRGAFLVDLDGRTGRLIDSAQVDSPDAAINFAVEGNLVLSAEPDAGGALEVYELRDARHLSKKIWSKQLTSSAQPQLLPDRLIVPLSPGTVSVDGRTGRETPWASDLTGIEGARVVDGGILGVTIPQGVGLGSFVELLDADGKSVWQVPALAVSSLESSRSCITMTSVTSKLTCIAPKTGDERWSVDFTGLTDGTPEGSTTDDIATIGPVKTGDTTLRIVTLDGATGATRATAVIPRGSDVVAESIATGFALDASTARGRSSLTAFDLSSGRTLWSISAGTIQHWGARFVEIDATGVAYELVDGRADPSHDMLGG
ncbi:PQQ-binding-like beta-propeller repeat protein [Frondihabitans sp. PAMC 28766]|uniref:outer membrane protein assembly factor BamB family protein n=1 Tax=Frondihabitans sp. PAMC 28766 TaxID=1795630 RepID=UPI00138EE8C3|nr:PQQ-binding-like beta-propeller repeat protein [Frondihabitans sp. PAMC 28766]